MSITESTNVIGLFGVGAAIGSMVGGLLGTVIYKWRKNYLPIFMGVTFIMACLMMQAALDLPGSIDASRNMPSIDVSEGNVFGSPLLSSTPSSPSSLSASASVVNSNFYMNILIMISASFAASNTTHVKALIMNVSSPMTRGASMSTMTFLNSFGRGIGPLIVTYLTHTCSYSRSDAIGMTMYLWGVAGLIEIIGCLFVERDEEAVRKEVMLLHSTLDVRRAS